MSREIDLRLGAPGSFATRYVLDTPVEANSGINGEESEHVSKDLHIINQTSQTAVDQVETYQYPSVVNTSFKVSCIGPSNREMPTRLRTAYTFWLGCMVDDACVSALLC